LRRDQLHRMPDRPQQPRPMMARTTGFDRDHRRGKLLEECHHLLAPQLLSQNRRFGGIHPMKLENVFRRIRPNSANLVHGRYPLSEIIHTTSFWHIDAVGGRPHQQHGQARPNQTERCLSAPCPSPRRLISPARDLLVARDAAAADPVAPTYHNAQRPAPTRHDNNCKSPIKMSPALPIELPLVHPSTVSD
jgi:hypothetical protein